jgi:hypothetical protein
MQLLKLVATGGVWSIHNRKLIHGMQFSSLCAPVSFFSLDYKLYNVLGVHKIKKESHAFVAHAFKLDDWLLT